MTDANEATSKAGRFWAWLPAGLLGTMFVGLGTLAYIAIDDPSFALEPNYYDKAVHWDSSEAEARASNVLGLKLEFTSPLTVGANGSVNVQLGVKDRRELAFSGAQVQIEAFPNAYASHVEHILLRETAAGVYTGDLSRGVVGLWELRIVVKQGALRYGEVRRLDVVKGGAA